MNVSDSNEALKYAIIKCYLCIFNHYIYNNYVYNEIMKCA